MRFSSLGIESQNTTVSADGLLATLSIDTTGIFGGSFQLLLAGVLPQLTNGPFATDFAGLPAEITSGVITVESSQPADLNGNGFVDFEDLTVLLAAWNQNVSAAEGNLVDAAGTPVNFDDLTVLLAAWNTMVSAAEGNLVNPEGTVVNFEDLTVLLSEWTGPPPGPAPAAAQGTASAVPEPSTLLLSLTSLCALAWRPRRRYR